MKKLFKYIPALILTGLLSIALINTADAQHRGGGHGGGGSRGGGGRGGSAFHGGGGSRGASFSRGSAVNRSVAVRGGASYRGSVGRATVGVRGGAAYRGSVRGAIGYNRGGYYRGGHYYGGRGFYRGGRYYGGYGPGFRFGVGFGYPHIGFYLGYLPFGYYPFYYGSLQYYYYGGAFYRPYNGGYEVVVPPVGAAVPTLPSNAQAIQIDGAQYYEANGVYYQEGSDDNGRRVYIVVGKDGVLNTGNNNVSDQQPMTDSDDPIMDNNNVANNQPQPQATQPAAPELTIKVGDVVDQLPPDCRKVTLNNKKYFVSADNIFYEEFKDANGTGYRVASIPGGTDQ